MGYDVGSSAKGAEEGVKDAIVIYCADSDLLLMCSFFVDVTRLDRSRKAARVRGYVFRARIPNGVEPPRVPGPRRPVDVAPSALLRGQQVIPHPLKAGS